MAIVVMRTSQRRLVEAVFVPNESSRDISFGIRLYFADNDRRYLLLFTYKLISMPITCIMLVLNCTNNR